MKKINNLKIYEDCLGIIDMINAFVYEGVLHDEDISKVITRQIELIKKAKNEGKCIAFFNDAHTEESVEFQRFANTTHSLKGSTEAQVVPQLREFLNGEDTFIFEKNSTSLMESPGFREFLENQPNLNNFEFVGCCTDICVTNGTIGLANYLDEHNRKHNIIVHEDAIATFNENERLEYINAAKLLMNQQGIKLVKKKYFF